MNQEIKNLSYRRGVGMMILNKKNKVWVGRRKDTSTESWQMPQGGIEDGENLEYAMRRELKEEVGIDNVKIIASSKKWLKYDIPRKIRSHLWSGKFRGQQQIWFLLKFLGNDSDIEIDHGYSKYTEFIEWKWIDIILLDRIIVDFKKNLYSQIIKIFKNYILDLEKDR